MSWFTKQKKEEDKKHITMPRRWKFQLFQPVSRPISAYFGRICRRPIWPDMADTARFWPNQPGSVRIEADWTRIKLSRRESKKKKKKKKLRRGTDVRATALGRIGRGCGTVPATSVLSRLKPYFHLFHYFIYIYIYICTWFPQEI